MAEEEEGEGTNSRRGAARKAEDGGKELEDRNRGT